MFETGKSRKAPLHDLPPTVCRLTPLIDANRRAGQVKVNGVTTEARPYRYQNESNSSLASSLKSNDGIDTTSAQAEGGRRNMTNDKILAPAPNCELTKEETHLAILAAKATKAAALAETPEDSKQWNDIALWHNQRLKLCTRLEVAKRLPKKLASEQQYKQASQLLSSFNGLSDQETKLFGNPQTPKPALVTEANKSRCKYRDDQAKLKTEAGTRKTTSRRKPLAQLDAT